MTRAPAAPAPSPALRRRAQRVLELLKIRYPEPQTHLVARDGWELLVATVLAAQCTDARVNTVTPELFRRWPSPAALADAPLEEVERVVRPTGFYHNKAANLIKAARRVTDVYGGKLPRTIAELTTLPGVARKTANVVLWGAMLGSLLLSTVILYVPFLADAFGFAHISLMEYFVALGIAILVIPIVELVKFVLRRAGK